MAKHTPGEWSTFPTPNDLDFAFEVEGVCSIHKGPHAQADARLIQAAPDLLGALKHAVDWLNSAGVAETMPVQQQARAAIAKAEGTPL